MEIGSELDDPTALATGTMRCVQRIGGFVGFTTSRDVLGNRKPIVPAGIRNLERPTCSEFTEYATLAVEVYTVLIFWTGTATRQNARQCFI